MIEETFAYGSSVMHRIDPRFRVVFATIFSFVAALSIRFPALIAALILSVLLVSMARLNLLKVIKKLMVVWGFILLLWLALPLTVKGEPLFSVGPLIFTKPGIILSLQITLKSNIILLAYIAMVTTMNLVTLGHSLKRLRVPDKIIHLFLLTYRYIFVIEQEYYRLVRAIKIRGFRPGTNRHTYRTYAYIVGMLFVRASERANRVHQAMICRGFKGRFYSLSKFSVMRQDWLWTSFMSLAMIVLIILEWINI